MSDGPEVLVVRTGTANIASICSALKRVGARSTITEDPDAVGSASHVVLPGVGAFGAAMKHLSASGMSGVLTERVRNGQRTLSVCLGFQLLCEESEESPGVQGLAVLPKTVGRFPRTVRVPQFGWNRIVPDENCRLLSPGFAYFANSYRLVPPVSGWNSAVADHGGDFRIRFRRMRFRHHQSSTQQTAVFIVTPHEPGKYEAATFGISDGEPPPSP